MEYAHEFTGFNLQVFFIKGICIIFYKVNFFLTLRRSGNIFLQFRELFPALQKTKSLICLIWLLANLTLCYLIISQKGRGTFDPKELIEILKFKNSIVLNLTWKENLELFISDRTENFKDEWPSGSEIYG